MAVRQALKINKNKISELWKSILELRDEIIQETLDDFVSDNKAEKDENQARILPEYNDEYINTVNGKLQELYEQSVDVEFQTIPEKEYFLYAEQNDGLFSDIELDVLELFVDNGDKAGE